MGLKTRLMLLVSVLMLTFAISSLKFVHLENGTNTELTKTGPITKIEIGKDVMQRFHKYFTQSYPLEYGTCIYGINKNNTIKILYDEVFMTYQTERSVGTMCPKVSKGLIFLGVMHSHPSADSDWCMLSNADIKNNLMILGVQCQDKILFYTKADGYSRGYFADEI